MRSPRNVTDQEVAPRSVGHAACAGDSYGAALNGAERGVSQSDAKLGARAEVVAAAAAPRPAAAAPRPAAVGEPRLANAAGGPAAVVSAPRLAGAPGGPAAGVFCCN